MADSLSIQPVALSRLTGISSVAFQRLTTGATSTSSIFTGSSNAVELSTDGLLLAAVSSFQTRLESLQANIAASSPSALASTAQSLVDAFNRLQSNSASSQTIVAALSSDTLTNQLSRSLSQLVATSVASDSTTRNSLQSIGIDLQSTATPTGTFFALSIDPNRLTAAIGADPVGTRTALSGAIQSFIDLAAEFESQAVSTAIPLTNLAQLGVTTPAQIDLNSILGLQTSSNLLGVGVPADLLQNLDADTVLNAIQLTDIDLAALGLDTDTVLAEDSVVRGALVTALLTPENPPTSTEDLLTSETVGANSQLASTTVPTAAVAATAAPTVETPDTAAQAPVPVASTTASADNSVAASAAQVANTLVANALTPDILAADVLAAERRASEAAQALQSLLADPGLRVLRNHFDPAYSALIAASHMSDFITPDRVLNPKALVDDAVMAVSPVANARAIAYYHETAGTPLPISPQ